MNAHLSVRLKLKKYFSNLVFFLFVIKVHPVFLVNVDILASLVPMVYLDNQDHPVFPERVAFRADLETTDLRESQHLSHWIN